ncbi:MAG: hypothetical protein AAFV53_20225, partial [Myxococcota bacterium]
MYTFSSLLAVVGLTSCTLSRLEPSPCTSDASCQSAFGVAYRCRDDGFCAADSGECATNADCAIGYGQGAVCSDAGICQGATLLETCSLWPDTLSFPILPEETLLVGTIFDHSLDTHVARFQSAQLAL